METKTLRRDANQVIIPSFAHVSGDAEKAEAIAKWVLTEIKEENWEPDLYATKFGFRTPRETLTERTRGFMAPCLDSSMAANIIFQNEGFDTTAVVDVVHIASENRNQLHTALEVTKSGKTWHFGVAPGRKGYLMGGKYKNPAVEGWTSLGHPLKFEGRRVGLDTKPFQAFFGITTMGELGTSIRM
ncbi:MAG: hypothetical protein FJY77_06175, partial [Candidatus Altiarchaeales archaeon]|nr:hypothetical protein [Candidatus Altiarchaeales archaeon]